MRARYDVVVVGAGSAGAALAARLSELPSRSVLLIDRGPDATASGDWPEAVRSDASLPAGEAPWLRWYDADLGAGRAGRLVRGEMVGGSGAVNGAYFVRGTPGDFDAWAALGNDLWSPDRVLDSFRRLETDLDLGEGPVHGGHGPVPVTRCPEEALHPVTAAFFEACAAAGHRPEPDMNAGGVAGYGRVPRNAVDGVRVNSAMAYLVPACDRPNLTVVGGVHARRVLFDRGLAVAVEVVGPDGPERIEAAEVVVCCGAIASTQLLMLSGIGPASHLREVGIPVVHDAGGVGTRCSDHPAIDLHYEPTSRWTDPGGSFLQGALHTSTGDGAPVEILATRRPYGCASGARPEERMLSLRVGLMATVGRGRVELVSADPAVAPRIVLSAIDAAEDRARLRDAVRQSAALLRAAEFADMVEVDHGPDGPTLEDDALTDRWIASNLGTSMHLSGTAPMGPDSDPGAVVDQRCRVRGVEQLRVVDTSIMPTVTTRGPACTAVMLGEHAAVFFD